METAKNIVTYLYLVSKMANTSEASAFFLRMNLCYKGSQYSKSVTMQCCRTEKWSKPYF